MGGCKVATSIYFGNARSYMISKTVLERPAKEGDSPVCENRCMRSVAILEYCPVRRLGRNPGGLVIPLPILSDVEAKSHDPLSQSGQLSHKWQ